MKSRVSEILNDNAFRLSFVDAYVNRFLAISFMLINPVPVMYAPMSSYMNQFPSQFLPEPQLNRLIHFKESLSSNCKII